MLNSVGGNLRLRVYRGAYANYTHLLTGSYKGNKGIKSLYLIYSQIPYQEPIFLSVFES